MTPQPSFDGKRIAWIAAFILLLGGLIGVGAGLLTLTLYGVERLALGYVEGAGHPGPYEVAAWRRVASVVGVSLFAAIAWWLLRTKTTKVPSVAAAVKGQRMPLWQTVAHVLLQIVIVGGGSSIGREVAPRELGAMLGQRFSGILHLDEHDRRVVVAAAAGAGLAGVYDAPFAGMFFAVEILLADVTLETVAMAFGSSCVAAFVAASIKGHGVFYDTAGLQSDITPTLMLFALLAGVLFGLAGAAFRRGSQWAERHKPSGAAVVWMMPVAALATGLVAVFAPQVMGNGRAAAQLSFTGASQATPGMAVQLAGVMAVTFAAKALLTIMTIRSGASGGVLQPGIALGAAMGTMLGVFWVLAFPIDSVTACALIGAAALLAASQQAPLMAMCLVMELTGAPLTFAVPVGIGVAVASLVSACTRKGVSRSERKRGGRSLQGGTVSSSTKQ